jgi:Protein of unknown function, DUF488
MKTACIWYKGPGRIVISRGIHGMAAGFKHYLKLAPTSNILRAAHAEDFDADVDWPKWIKRFEREVLAPLDPQAVYRELHTLVPGVEPVLLCYEKPDDPNMRCHRRIVASWFERHLGIEVPELAIALQQQKY